MGRYRYATVDVFAEKKYAGNQLAVFLRAGTLSDWEMQRIAREMNYSETSFVLSNEEISGGYDVRIFTPEEELPFAGHPTLGTAFVIQKEIVRRPVERIVLNLKAGQIPVTLDYTSDLPNLWMTQLPPSFGRQISRQQLADVLNVSPDAIDARFPVEEVSTGLPFLIVPMRDLESVRNARLNWDKFLGLIAPLEAKSILIFCPETYEPQHDLNVRVFTNFFGIPEDPATGSANGCLAGYLVQHRYYGTDEINVQVEQGYEINRPSLLLLKAEKTDEIISIRVGGKVIPVASGELE